MNRTYAVGFGAAAPPQKMILEGLRPSKPPAEQAIAYVV